MEITSNPTKCTGHRYVINPDFPDEGTDVRHDGPCPVHCTYRLMDADTAEPIGPATDEQVAASFDAVEDGYETGVILIDADGDVVLDGTWDAQQPGVRKVYVEEA